MSLPWIDIVGYWIGIFLTLAILSYLYKDNPFYKLAEHLFVGVSIGYVVIQQYYGVIRPNLIDRFSQPGWYIYLLPLALVVMLFVKAVSRRLSWVGRYPIAFAVALYAGLQINAVAQSDLAEQIKASAQPVDVAKVDVNDPASTTDRMATLPGFTPVVAKKVEAARAGGMKFASLDDLKKVPGLNEEQRKDLDESRGWIAGLDAQASVRPGGRFWFGIVSRFLLLIGLCASLVYFYFSIEQKGAIGRVSRFGVWVLMIGFGASFGYTVQGRLSLAVGRAMDLLDKDKDARLAQQIHGPWASLLSIVLIVAGLIVWERWQKRPRAPSPPPSDGGDLPSY